MKKLAALFATLGVLSTVVALADPPKPAKPTAKVADVWTCPITGEAIKDHKASDKGVLVANKYRVHFCCGGCPETFAKLSDKDKLAKAEAAYKKENPKKDAPKKS